MAMLDLFGNPQLYAAGLTLAVIWLVILLQSGIRRLVAIVLQNRATAWIAPVTILLQAIFVLNSAILIVSRLGMQTSLAVSVVLLLWLVVASLRPDSAVRTGFAKLRSSTLREPDSVVVTTVPPVPNATHPSMASTLSQPAVLSTVEQSATVVTVAPKTEPPSPTPVPMIRATAEVATAKPVMAKPLVLPVAVNQIPTRKPASLTRRPTLGKKTTVGLL